MSPIVQQINLLLAAFTVAGQILIVVWLLANVFLPKHPLSHVVRDFLNEKSLLVALIVSVTATAGSLFYSEIAHFTPCLLCWYQRILMYPQVILLGLALWKKDKGIALYSLALSAIGALMAGYHYLLQLGVVPAPCAAVGYSESCSQRFVMSFGYITIPLMAFTAFVIIALCMVTLRRKKILGIF